jgi:beta-galactosidase GanA
MNQFVAEGGQFWLDGKPQFIQAGELHYFRIPRDQWRHRLDLLIGAGFNTLAVYIPWLWHQLVEDESDFDGRSHPLRDLAGFLDLAADMGLLIIARPGPYIMAETINEFRPGFSANFPGQLLSARILKFKMLPAICIRISWPALKNGTRRYLQCLRRARLRGVAKLS